MRVGLYEVISLLGAGGMGEVYRARDTKLNRDVAIKVLPERVAADPERLARFHREAQVLAALNHPNIAHVYGLSDSDRDTSVGPLLVMELVEGDTLADRITRGPIPLVESLAIARQVATALDAAHEQGIVHRDLKPANIKIRNDGTIKVLDFGLAKMMDPQAELEERRADLTASPTMTLPGMTSVGVVLGTAPYMSPEQARGTGVDKRTDIWAFGCLLYEMLTGRRAFRGDTTSDTVAAVLEREPDWTRLPSTTPVSIVQTLRRCLEKNVKDRLRDIGDVRLDPLEAAAATAHASSPGRSAVTLLSAIAAILSVTLVWSFRRAAGSPESARLLPMERLTYDAGLTTSPAISRDGRLLAYASDRSGRGDLDIWVQQTVGGTPIRLTDDPADESTPDFSPDGGTVLFRSERNGGGVYLVSALGGEPRFLAPDGRQPKFSPDGSRIVYWSGLQRGGANGASKTSVLPLAGGESIPVLPEFEVVRNAVWAPDGRSLLLVAKKKQNVPGSGGDNVTDWWWAPLDGRAPIKTFTVDPIWGGGVFPSAWTASGVLFSQGGDLWSLTVSPTTGRATGSPRRLTSGAQQYDTPAAGPNGDVIFTARTEQRIIDRVSLSGGEPVTLYEDSRSDFGRATQTRDGTKIVFERGLARTREIWMKEIATGRQRMVLQLDDPREVDANVSPNGSRIAYTSRQSGYVVDVSGGVPRKICEACTVFGFLSDSRRVLVVAAEKDRAFGRVVDVETSMVRDALVTERVNLTRLHASPDDRWLAFQFLNKVYVTPLTPGRPPPSDAWQLVDQPTTTGRPCGWSLDARMVYLLLDLDGFRCLYGQRVDGTGRLVGKPEAVRHFHERNNAQGFGTGYADAMSAAGFLYEGPRVTGNLWRLPQQVLSR
jgi:serine/threonine protein kinase